ncbi:hypothetical protein [Coxiella endosymbiont of Ornithodoros maritimus]|uniref:hypothetical protein n=1 Tax=Coxiella endosymbiont of Ornithodoros maritimus TaxID=1656172 RepID=UPI0022644321|nr:hypothetical protein [Coxiella endosymbiont of Ornithodoros maritimus]
MVGKFREKPTGWKEGWILFDLLIVFCNSDFLRLDGILEMLEKTNSRYRACGHLTMDRSGGDAEKGVRIRENMWSCWLV